MMSKIYLQMIAVSAIMCSISCGSPVWAGFSDDPSSKSREAICTTKWFKGTCKSANKSTNCVFLNSKKGAGKKNGCHSLDFYITNKIYFDVDPSFSELLNGVCEEEYGQFCRDNCATANLTDKNKMQVCKDACNVSLSNCSTVINTKTVSKPPEVPSKTKEITTKEGCEQEYGSSVSGCQKTCIHNSLTGPGTQKEKDIERKNCINICGTKLKKCLSEIQK